MKKRYRPGIFIVTYAKTNKGIRYVVLKRKKHWTGWEFPKGGIDSGEDVYETARREIEEETGVKAKKIIDFNEKGKYHYKKAFPDRPDVVGQTYHLFAAEIPKKKISVDEGEHFSGQWMDYESAKNKLTFENQKDCLEKVNNWLLKLKRFRSFKTPSGKIVFAGKDKKTNEELINNSEPDEDVFHTEESGSPFCVVKKLPVESPFNKKHPTKEDLRQAAIYCASKSQDWRDNKSDVVVHWFLIKDTKKTKSLKNKTGTFSVDNFKKLKIKKKEIKEFIENKE
ncbi:MAG TPA: NFACT RNA binding domain-containing protein [Candidatus Nanoarchaeia archaeon]|nr:NFACT RNA binding domain-containing protein [Candidatus Nanoarchaeia archaeon]